jgi:hypothetical protein
MSEKLTSLEGCFGLAEVKIEGSSTRLDHKIEGMGEAEETYWLEWPFTKAEFAHLADLLESSSEAFARELGKSCRRRSKNGWG